MKNWKKNKKPWRYYHFTHVYHKWQSYDAWFLRYWAWETGSFWTIFCPYTPLTTQKIRILKSEKKAWRYYHFTNAHNKWQSYDVWFLRYEAWWTEFFVILDHFFHFYPPKNLKNENFKKMKKNPGDIITLHKYKKNHDHMLYCSWDMAHDGCNCYFSFWVFFCSFTPTAQKIKISKKWKIYLEISSFYTCGPKITIRWCTVPEIWCVMNRRTDRRTDGKSDI